MGHKDFFLRSKDSGSRIAGSGGGKIIFFFFWPLNSMIFLIFYDLKKKAKDFYF
jgi:hypothetical protein